MTATNATTCLIVPGTGDSPAERFIVTETLEQHDPETYLTVTFNRPDSSATLWHAWTGGGSDLADLIDGIARTVGLDAADWCHISDRHRVTADLAWKRVEAYPLRPILADVHNGERCDDHRRRVLAGFLDLAAHPDGQPAPQLHAWPGYGPALLSQPKGQ
ncbi:hypothetical protein [Streptomyces sp. AMCC400023]|uniref:hypothetical protein n=1 Tax=Streptomyces sp. AMCC400023 TaxID=2056258 RepID=UPI001F2A2241|nr:hypothetical protein [Streptomyces sp. AMCC400023]UJV42931.1 hypothetical protein CVT30_26590 [Streptomyces sp. AMCC400023]